MEIRQAKRDLFEPALSVLCTVIGAHVSEQQRANAGRNSELRQRLFWFGPPNSRGSPRGGDVL